METVSGSGDSWTDLASKLPGLVVQFASMGMPGWIAGGVLLILVLVGGFFINRWLEARKQEASDRQNEDHHDNAEATLPGQVSELEHGARDGIERIRTRIAERMALNLEERIKRIPVQAPIRGAYKTPSGWPRGAVVHYTSGNSVNNELEATGLLKDLASRGLSSFLIGTDGQIWAPSNLGPKDQHAHAGESVWRGETAVSARCFGIEIACAGLLDSERRSWFGRIYPEDQTRKTEAVANRAAGIYHRYTEAQEKSLMDLLAWHLRFNPEFSPDWVVGHDEIAPGRKTDPGASLSVTMPELRRMLAEMRAAQ